MKNDILTLHEELIEEEKESSWKGPLRIIIGLFLVLLIVLWLIPAYSIKMDPSPRYIPDIKEVIPNGIELGNENVSSGENYLNLVRPADPVVKRTADKIVSLSGCSSSKVCQAKAMFYFVRDKFDYVGDPLGNEYVKSAAESLVSGGGDCDDGSVLVANLLGAVGIRTRFVFVPGHVYVQAYMPDSPRKYRKEGWINMDVTCSYCEFGEVPYGTNKAEKRYLG